MKLPFLVSFKLRQLLLIEPTRLKSLQGEVLEKCLEISPWPESGPQPELGVCEETARNRRIKQQNKSVLTIELRFFLLFKVSLSHFPKIHLFKCITESH